MTDQYLTSLNAYVDGLLSLSDEVELQRTLVTGELPERQDSKEVPPGPHAGARLLAGGDHKISRSPENVRH